MLQTNSFFKEGRNELLVGVRNKVNDLGGFSFRMDYDYVVDPQWVSTDELTGISNLFEIYPNPNDGMVNISSNEVVGPSTVSVYNAKGLTVYEEQHDTFPLQLNLKTLPTGIYHLLVKSSHYSYSKKFIRQ